MNDTTRELGSAIGIALMGALYATNYRDNLPDVSHLPAKAQELTHDSAPGGMHVASHLPSAQGGPLRAGVESAFMDGLSTALLVVAVILAVSAFIVLAFAPRDHATSTRAAAGSRRVPFNLVAAAVWMAVDLGALALLAMILWVFPPEHGLLPEPSWLVDPVAGWVLGNVVGVALHRVLANRTPWAIAAVALALVAVCPVVFAAYPALGAFVSGAIIGCAAGGLFWRARRDDATVLL